MKLAIEEGRVRVGRTRSDQRQSRPHADLLVLGAVVVLSALEEGRDHRQRDTVFRSGFVHERLEFVIVQDEIGRFGEFRGQPLGGSRAEEDGHGPGRAQVAEKVIDYSECGGLPRIRGLSQEEGIQARLGGRAESSVTIFATTAPKYVANAKYRNAGGVSRCDRYRSAKSRPSPSMADRGTVGGSGGASGEATSRSSRSSFIGSLGPRADPARCDRRNAHASR